MANMSYCRFQNTAGDLDDCQGALEALLSGGQDEDGDKGPLSYEELRAAQRLVVTCQNIVEMLADYQCRPVEDMTELDLEAALDDANSVAQDENLEEEQRQEEEEREEQERAKV